MKKYLLAAAAIFVLGAANIATAADGQTIYKKICFACHDFGAAGAPKLTKKAKWAPRIAKGVDALVTTVKTGLNAMPPRGTCAACSDEDLRAAVVYMIDQAK